ncbi:HNH endonuclease [uncultured Enterococcus sp.]|uniref:HNH endonuclease n=1 Tax=uncultured Enterococcus sp. TaxID=167972 RepID=UPI002593FD0E|nr:HNH endonuclease [uncultured Enterococcus sp.]
MKKANPFYLTAEWRQKRIEILERDHYECLWCKAEGKLTTQYDAILEIDHIKELETHPELAWDNDNLQTLCRSCHNKKHHRFEFKESNRKRKWDDEWW